MAKKNGLRTVDNSSVVMGVSSADDMNMNSEPVDIAPMMEEVYSFPEPIFPRDGFNFKHNNVITWIQDTLPQTGSTCVRFRIKDQNNFWEVNVNNGGNIYLVQYMAGEMYERSAAMRVVKDGDNIFINTDKDRINVVVNDTLVMEYVGANLEDMNSGVLYLLGFRGVVSYLR